MKTILKNKTALLLLSFVCVAMASCLKDKGWEEGKYGSVRNTEGKEYATIPKAARATNAMGLESKDQAQDVSLFTVAYDYVNPASSDITATVRVNNDLVTAADPSVTILPASTYTVPSTTLTVSSGSRISNELKIRLNTGSLDPNKKYGIAFTLESVSKSGVQIPDNMKNVVFVFTLKNKYDGVFTLRSQMLHPVDRSADWLRTPFAYPYDIELMTTGPKTVVWNNLAYGDGLHPLMAPGVSGFGSTRVEFTFDDNDKLVKVANIFENPSNGRAFKLNDNVSTSRFEVTPSGEKVIYAAFYMTQPGFEPIPIYDTLRFKAARK